MYYDITYYKILKSILFISLLLNCVHGLKLHSLVLSLKVPQVVFSACTIPEKKKYRISLNFGNVYFFSSFKDMPPKRNQRRDQDERPTPTERRRGQPPPPPVPVQSVPIIILNITNLVTIR